MLLAGQMATDVIGPYTDPTCFTHNDLPLCNVMEQLGGVDHVDGHIRVRGYDAGCAKF